jgi:hypothetical protein
MKSINIEYADWYTRLTKEQLEQLKDNTISLEEYKNRTYLYSEELVEESIKHSSNEQNAEYWSQMNRLSVEEYNILANLIEIRYINTQIIL